MAKKVVAIAIVIFLLMGIVASFVFGEEEISKANVKPIVHDEASCKEFARLYMQGDSYDTLFEHYDTVKAMRMPKEYFSNQLKKLERITGKFISFGKFKQIENEKSKVYVLYLNMEHKKVVMMLTMAAPYRGKFDPNIYSKIHMLQFAIVDDETDSNKFVDSIVSLNSEHKYEFVDANVTINSKLNGIISYPDSKRSMPAVLLLQADGAYDKDYRVGNTYIFKDIANALAQNAIISLRYNTRQYEQNNIFDNKDISPYNTVIDDAVLALDLLAKDNRVDKSKIYILAHGNSTYYVPQILKKMNFNVAGLIYLSSSPLSVLDLYNIDTVRKLDGLSEEKLYEAIKIRKDDINSQNLVKTLGDDESKNIKIYGKNAYYFKSQLEWDNDAIYLDKRLPMFIIHGEYDTDVPSNYGIKLWNEKFENNKKVILKSYSKLNNMLIAENEDTVSKEVLTDIASWILQDKGE